MYRYSLFALPRCVIVDFRNEDKSIDNLLMTMDDRPDRRMKIITTTIFSHPQVLEVLVPHIVSIVLDLVSVSLLIDDQLITNRQQFRRSFNL